jgi:hypothetical protein
MRGDKASGRLLGWMEQIGADSLDDVGDATTRFVCGQSERTNVLALPHPNSRKAPSILSCACQFLLLEVERRPRRIRPDI